MAGGDGARQHFRPATTAGAIGEEFHTTRAQFAGQAGKERQLSVRLLEFEGVGFLQQQVPPWSPRLQQLMLHVDLPAPAANRGEKEERENRISRVTAVIRLAAGGHSLLRPLPLIDDKSKIA